MTSNPIRMAVAAFVLLAGAASAFAAPAAVAINVNVRSGPGTAYEAVDVLVAGELVEVLGCRDQWCLVNYGDWNGWVSGGYLDFRREARPEPRPSQPWGQEYPVRYENQVEIRQYYDLPPHVNQQVGDRYQVQQEYEYEIDDRWSQGGSTPVAAPVTGTRYAGGSSAW